MCYLLVGLAVVLCIGEFLFACCDCLCCGYRLGLFVKCVEFAFVCFVGDLVLMLLMILRDLLTLFLNLGLNALCLVFRFAGFRAKVARALHFFASWGVVVQFLGFSDFFWV